MLGLLAGLSYFVFAAAQPTQPLSFTDTTLTPIIGNYTMGYVNNTQENRCHRATAKFQAKNTGIVETMKMGVYSQATAQTCGISFVLSTYPGAVNIGSSLLTSFTDLVAARPGTEEFVSFNATPSVWSVVAGQNYTVTILPFTWTTGSAGTTGTTHCVFQIPYGNPGLPYSTIGQHGPTALPCGSTPWVTDFAGDGIALHLMLNGRAASITVPSPSSSITPTPTPTGTPTPTRTGTATPSPTPTVTPTISNSPTSSLAAGITPSNTPTISRTSSRTPSVSYSATPTISMTSSPTPTSTPSPTTSIRIGASPSVTPTETRGPTDSPSPSSSTRGAGDLSAAALAAAPISSAGSIVGGIIGGVILTVAVLAIAIRYKVVSAHINDTSWQTQSKRKLGMQGSEVPYLIGTDHTVNQQINQQANNPTLSPRITRVKYGPESTNIALQQSSDLCSPRFVVVPK